MKKLLVLLTIIIFSFSMISFANADRRKENKRNDRGRYYHQKGPDHSYRWHGRKWKHHGRDHRRHRYEYQGHWKSRHKWEKHRKRYPHKYRHGRYSRYKDNRGHVMFSFCDGTGMCFSFSIAD